MERETERDRLDRIERLIKQVSEASSQLQEELARARRLSAERDGAAKTHLYPPAKPAARRRAVKR